MLKYYRKIEELCQYLDIIYKKNYTVSNIYTVSKKHRKNLFRKTKLKKGCKGGEMYEKEKISVVFSTDDGCR